MTLAEFIKHKQSEILRFEAAWEASRETEPKNFPMKFEDDGVAHWDAQYEAWCELISTV